MYKEYSVLMSVYQKEYPEYLRAAITSIVNQTLKAKEFVLVCDGPLTNALEQVLDEFSNILILVRLEKNVGLGMALAEGMRYCNCEWIVRMDSDDIAFPDRCKKQIIYVQQHPEIDVLSGTVAEFEGSALTAEEAKQQVVSLKFVPETDREITEYIKFRNPINHPCVMFRKSKAAAAGGYQQCHMFEDYDLWVRMFKNKCVFANLTDTILYMRVNNMHMRRGGISYAKAVLHFWSRMYRQKMIGLPQYIFIIALRIIISLCPNQFRKMVYDKRLRNHSL